MMMALVAEAQQAGWPQGLTMLRIATYDKHHTDAFSFGLNPAGLGGIKKFSVGIAGERKYFMEELNEMLGVIGIPTSKLNIGMRFLRFGNAVYNENLIGIGFGKSVSPLIDVGIQFNYFSRSVQNYGSASAVNAEAGFVFHISDVFRTGIHIYNPTGVKVGKTSERMASVYTVGLGFAPSEKFFLAFDIRKVEDQPVHVHSGFHYFIVERVRLSGGMTSAASSFYAGFAFKLNNLHLSIYGGNHSVLGWTPGLALNYIHQQ